jgi:hypothetical protein
MKSERIILSFVAIIVGLVVAGIAFYFYQMTRTVQEPATQQATGAKNPPTPTPDKNLFLSVQNPKNEEVVSKKIITVAGKTTPTATIVVSSEIEDKVVKPAKNGDFTLTQTIGDGANLIQITAIFPSGVEKSVYRTVTYSTESF